jgi:hypothetical protein
MNVSSKPFSPAQQRQNIPFTVAHTMVQEGEQIADLFQSIDNSPLDHDPRPGFVDMQNPHKFYDKAQFTTNQEGTITNLALSNNWGMHPSRTWAFDQNGSATTLTINNPTYAKVDQTVYHFEFGPNTESWMERVYQIS